MGLFRRRKGKKRFTFKRFLKGVVTGGMSEKLRAAKKIRRKFKKNPKRFLKGLLTGGMSEKLRFAKKFRNRKNRSRDSGVSVSNYRNRSVHVALSSGKSESDFRRQDSFIEQEREIKYNRSGLGISKKVLKPYGRIRSGGSLRKLNSREKSQEKINRNFGIESSFVENRSIKEPVISESIIRPPIVDVAKGEAVVLKAVVVDEKGDEVKKKPNKLLLIGGAVFALVLGYFILKSKKKRGR